MAITISIALQKGGTGKTTTALALASILGSKKKKVLLLDLDGQGNTTFASGVDTPNLSMTDILGEQCTIKDVIIPCKYYNLAPADPYLSNVEQERNFDNTLLKKVLQKDIDNIYDYIIIDTPPAMGNLLALGLAASDYVIVPIETKPFCIQGLTEFNRTIKTVQSGLNPKLKILGILLIKYSKRTVLSQQLSEIIQDYARQMHASTFSTAIREGICVAEAQTKREPLIDYAARSNPTRDYRAFAEEVIKKIGDE